jgi:hypothetical protein
MRVPHGPNRSFASHAFPTSIGNASIVANYKLIRLSNGNIMKTLSTIALIGLIFLAVAKAIEVESENRGGQTKVDRLEDEAAEVGENKFGISLSRLRKLLDFSSYKARFHKLYRSPLEESVRLKQFLANCHHVFTSAVNYRFGRSSYYLAVNSMSDWLLSELEALKNKRLASKRRKQHEQAGELEPKLAESGRFERHANVPDADAEPAQQAFVKLQRKKRDLTGEPAGIVVSDFRIEQAFDRSDDEMDRPSCVSDAASSAPNSSDRYDRPNEPDSQEASSEVTHQQEWRYKPVVWRVAKGKVARSYDHLPNRGMRNVLGRMKDTLRAVILSEQAETEDEQPDVVWVDHRQNGCFKNRVKHQRNCGSCYAASAIAYMEWVHCNETGELRQFAVGFIVHCGPSRSDDIDGCGGGTSTAAGYFIGKYGLELASMYPHLEKLDHQCPYKADTPVEHTGYLKANIEEVVEIEVEHMEEFLERTPLIVDVCTTFFAFEFYGGGIYAGNNCKQESNHMMVLVGHGRQNGEEYWLLRNSYGESWGESGYMKVNKNSAFIEGAYMYNENGAKFNIRRNPNVKERAEPIDECKKSGKLTKLFRWNNY